MTSLSTHKERVDQAQRTLAEGCKALFRPDGQKRFSDTEHIEQEAALERAFRTTIAEAAADAQRVIDASEKELQRGLVDPLSTLSQAELERANLQSAFLQADYETLPLVELARRAEHALAGDKGTRYLHWRFASQRVREVRDAVAGGRLSSDPTSRRAVETLATLSERLLGSLVDLNARRRVEERAKAEQAEAFGVLSRAAVTRYMQSEYGPRQPAWRGFDS